jgi:predicted metal-dependent HD superfamily phosphohydrolase
MHYQFHFYYPAEFNAYQKIDIHRLHAYFDFMENVRSCLSFCGAMDRDAVFGARQNLERIVANGWAYHGLVHVLSILQFHQTVKTPGEFEIDHHQQLALWFHDSIYDPRLSGTGENEGKSAEFLYCCAPDSVDVSKAQEYIFATAEFNNPGPVDEKIAQILDLDLCYFASEPNWFRQGADALASEYVDIYTPEEYHEGRKEFLQGLLDRGFIYRTKFFKKHFESKAVKNLKAAIEWKLPSA